MCSTMSEHGTLFFKSAGFGKKTFIIESHTYLWVQLFLLFAALLILSKLIVDTTYHHQLCEWIDITTHPIRYSNESTSIKLRIPLLIELKRMKYMVDSWIWNQETSLEWILQALLFILRSTRSSWTSLYSHYGIENRFNDVVHIPTSTHFQIRKSIYFQFVLKPRFHLSWFLSL